MGTFTDMRDAVGGFFRQWRRTALDEPFPLWGPGQVNGVCVICGAKYVEQDYVNQNGVDPFETTRTHIWHDYNLHKHHQGLPDGMGPNKPLTAPRRTFGMRDDD
ncbi:MAG: hypothetical protein H0U66_06180 [Gemmatimonadaceae bacterium]|nr:hypothetical protein [Gemmatimonadaceae bacterium]